MPVAGRSSIAGEGYQSEGNLSLRSTATSEGRANAID